MKGFYGGSRGTNKVEESLKIYLRIHSLPKVSSISHDNILGIYNFDRRVYLCTELECAIYNLHFNKTIIYTSQI